MVSWIIRYSVFILFRNKVHDLVRHVDLFDQVFAFQEGGNSFICFGNLEGFFLFAAVRDYDGASYLTVDLYTDFYGIVDGFAFILFRPLCYCQQAFSTDELPDFLTDMRCKWAEQFDEDSQVVLT